jgi:mannose-1-phosphate guanylyltransferase
VIRPTRTCWVVILAGGDGRRLGSLTTNASGVSTPKQFWSLNGGPSLLQLSLQRALRLVPRERIVTVVTEAHRRWWEPSLLSLRRSTVVVQPSNRGTGLGVLLPLLVIAKSDPEAGVICIPSDHYVEREDVLADVLRQATAPDVLDSDKLTLLGMAPNAPDSGFGYLCPVPDSGVGMRPVHRFVEKPDAVAAGNLIRAGSVWSSGRCTRAIPRSIFHATSCKRIPRVCSSSPFLRAVGVMWARRRASREPSIHCARLIVMKRHRTPCATSISRLPLPEPAAGYDK